MFNPFKITSRVLLVLGLIFLSFKPSSSNYVAPGTFHATSAVFSKNVALSQQTPLSQRSAELRSSFHKDDDRRHFPIPVMTVLPASVFVFNTPFQGEMSMVVSKESFSSVQTVFLRI